MSSSLLDTYILKFISHFLHNYMSNLMIIKASKYILKFSCGDFIGHHYNQMLILFFYNTLKYKLYMLLICWYTIHSDCFSFW